MQMNNGVSQIHKKGKTKPMVDKLFSLGTNKLVGSKLVIKRVIFVFASIQKKFMNIEVIEKATAFSQLLFCHIAHKNLRMFAQ